MTSAPPNTAEWITAFATVSLGIGAVIALIQIGEPRKDRKMQMMFELGRRWDSPEMIHSRHLVDACGGPMGVRTKIEKLFPSKGTTYWELMREPGFFEDMAILRTANTVDRTAIDDSMTYLVRERWIMWADASEFLQKKRGPEQFIHFQGWARELADRSSPVMRPYGIAREPTLGAVLARWGLWP